MKKQWIKRIAAASGALLLAAAAVPLMPTSEVNAAGGESFVQQIKVVDKTDKIHTAGIVIAPIQVVYHLTPVTETANLPTTPATLSRYIQSDSEFPNGNLTGNTDSKTFEVKANIVPASNTVALVSESDGTLTFDVPLDATGADVTGGLAGTGQTKNKVYRYLVEMKHIYPMVWNTSAFAPDTNTDYFTTTNSTFSNPDSTSMYLDLYIDNSNTVTTIMRKSATDESETAKYAGFMAANNDAISYNVYDIVLSTNYVGGNTGSVASSTKYTMTISNLPSYLTQSFIGNMIFTDTGSATNYNFVAATSPAANTAEFSTSNLSEGFEVFFGGIPVNEANPVTYKAAIDYSRIADPTSYDPSIYAGSQAKLISGISSLNDFLTFNTSNDSRYSIVDETGSNTPAHTGGPDATPMMTSADNNVRFVVFDPNLLIIVGVVVRVLPGVVLLGAALGGGFLMFHRRRREF